ncbi:UNVERIFIED_CONTAM: hypothetical protein K2H54_061130 [Gekko kuhli]
MSSPPKSVSDAELSKKKNVKKSKGGIKIEVMHEASQGGSSRILVMSESEENLSTRRSVECRANGCLLVKGAAVVFKSMMSRDEFQTFCNL